MKYNPAIDGLRAIAVISVLFFHLGLSAAPGGFSGVDIFFVISGFLISRIILREMAEGTFSFVTFFDRRIRRIIPALYVMLLATFVAGFVVLMPEDYAEYGASLTGAALSFSNFTFHLQSGYFTTLAEFRPLLHTWSLAVEEQFYLVFPPLILILVRLKLPHSIMAAVVAGLLFASLLEAQVLLERDPSAAFYMLPFRMWELLAGTLLAFYDLWNCKFQGRVINEAIGLVGLVLVGVSLFGIDSDTPFPGLAALPAVLGSTAILFAVQHTKQGENGTWVGKALAFAPMKFFGKISYSLYLWHWPIIVFYRHYFSYEISLFAAAVMGTLSVLLAYLSFRFIETPVRKSSFSLRHLPKAGGFAAATGFIAVLGVFLYVAHGLSARIDKPSLQLLAALKDSNPDRKTCHRDRNGADFDLAKQCVFGVPDAKPTVAVWGDSHGAELAYAVGQIFTDRHRGDVVEITASRCPPLMDVDIPGRPDCRELNNNILQALTKSDINTVVLAGFWRSHFETGRLSALKPAMQALHDAGKKVIVVGLVPSPPDSGPQRVAQLNRRGLLTDPYFFSPEADIQNGADKEIRDMATGLATVLLPRTILCPAPDRCPLYANGMVYYFDTNHLTLSAAGKVAREVVAAGEGEAVAGRSN